MFHAARTASISAARLLVFAAEPPGPGQRGTKRGRRRVAERRADLARLGREQLVGENGGDEPGIISSATRAGANCLVVGAGNLADDVAECVQGRVPWWMVPTEIDLVPETSENLSCPMPVSTNST